MQLRTLLCAAVLSGVFLSPAQGKGPGAQGKGQHSFLNRMGRRLGLGWSDGYHAGGGAGYVQAIDRHAPQVPAPAAEPIPLNSPLTPPQPAPAPMPSPAQTAFAPVTHSPYVASPSLPFPYGPGLGPVYQGPGSPAQAGYSPPAPRAQPALTHAPGWPPAGLVHQALLPQRLPAPRPTNQASRQTGVAHVHPSWSLGEPRSLPPVTTVPGTVSGWPQNAAASQFNVPASYSRVRYAPLPVRLP